MVCITLLCIQPIQILRILLSMSLDSTISNVVSVSGPYTELHERFYLHGSCFGTYAVKILGSF